MNLNPPLPPSKKKKKLKRMFFKKFEVFWILQPKLGNRDALFKAH